jgi:hypothetical protein
LPAHSQGSVFEQISLQQLLFNFLDDTWTKLMERIGMWSIDDFTYELVQLDAEGEANDQSFDDVCGVKEPAA